MNIVAEIFKSFSPVSEGFLFMWVLALIAVAAIVLVIERWVAVSRRTDVDASSLVEQLKRMVRDEQYDRAFDLCATAGKRALPRILGAGIKMAKQTPALIRSAMEEETLHMMPILERRIQYILTFGNISTLLGLMGTIYGLILSFAAVARPDVAAVEKSALLASGISTAMNTTLFGLIISVPCILSYSMFRSKIDRATQEIDRYAISLIKVLLPTDVIQKDYRVSARRIKEEVDTEPNIAPMMNLMVILIPLLLTSAEFVKIGGIEMKLPEAAQGSAGERGGGEDKKTIKLNLGISISDEGFTLYHYFKSASEPGKTAPVSTDEVKAQIPKVKGKYDYNKLNAELAKVKQKALVQVLRTVKSDVPETTDLTSLYKTWVNNKERFEGAGVFEDLESVKIVAEEKIKYQTVVAVMDAARGTKTPTGKVTMFPNVSLNVAMMANIAVN